MPRLQLPETDGRRCDRGDRRGTARSADADAEDGRRRGREGQRGVLGDRTRAQLKLDPPPAPAAEDEAAAPDYAAFKGVKFSE